MKLLSNRIPFYPLQYKKAVWKSFFRRPIILTISFLWFSVPTFHSNVLISVTSTLASYLNYWKIIVLSCVLICNTKPPCSDSPNLTCPFEKLLLTVPITVSSTTSTLATSPIFPLYISANIYVRLLFYWFLWLTFLHR